MITPRKDGTLLSGMVEDVPSKPDKPNDVLKKERLHNRLLSWWHEARDYQSVNRYQQAIDADFYDGIQWDEIDAETLQQRGQAPLVYNKIAPAINWILGTEKRTRIDFNVYPRTKDGNKTAQVKKDVLKYLSDCNKTVFARSRAFADAVIVGVGWLEDSIIGNDTQEPLHSDYVSWKNIWYDHHGVKNNLSDARYLFRSKCVYIDYAVAMFPEHASKLRYSAKTDPYDNEISSDEDMYYGRNRDSQGNVLSRRSFINDAPVANQRERVRLIECWYRDPVSMKQFVDGEYKGEYYDKQNQGHVKAHTELFNTLTDCLVMKMRVAIMTTECLLQDIDSPYNHNDFPFTPIWGYRRQRDNAPYGVVRNIRDPQESLNKRMSKAVHILSTNQIIADEAVATDWDLIANEVARPDGVILLDGQNASTGRFEINRDNQLANEHIQLADRDEKMIQDVSGVTDENLGRDTNATSGKAITARQQQGGIVTAELFDNLRFAVQLQGEKQLALVEQFYTDEKIIRVTGYRGSVDFVPINQYVYDEQSGQMVMLNPMTAEKSTFVVDEQDYQASMRDAMMQTMTELLRTMPPEISLQLLDLVYENSDLPARDEITARIRQINGQKDPTAEQTPEMMQAEAEKAEQQKQQQQMTLEAQQLELEKLKAEVAKLKADTTVKNVEGMFSAISAAKEVALIPAIAPMSDEVYKSAGGIDYNGYPIINNPMALPLPQPPQQNTHPQYPPNPQVGMMQGIDDMQ